MIFVFFCCLGTSVGTFMSCSFSYSPLSLLAPVHLNRRGIMKQLRLWKGVGGDVEGLVT